MRANRVEARKLIIMIIDVLAPVARRAAGEQRRHRPALNRRRALHPGIVEEGRRIVDILDRRRDARARADMPRILDQERRSHRFFITEPLVEPAMLDRESTRLNSSHSCASRMTAFARTNKQTHITPQIKRK